MQEHSKLDRAQQQQGISYRVGSKMHRYTVSCDMGGQAAECKHAAGAACTDLQYLHRRTSHTACLHLVSQLPARCARVIVQLIAVVRAAGAAAA
jgi:hypothetical protein